MKKKILAALIALQMTAALIGCDDDDESAVQTNGSQSVSQADDDGQEDTSGGDGSWNIFVYMCGSDLESQNGMATGDIQEMIASSSSENVKFIVETGGSGAWQQEDISTDSLQRYEICGGEMNMVGEADSASMGDPESLKDFLSWGAENYEADRTGLIFWDHGGGSVAGVCFDELAESDSLSLPELDSALSEVSESTGNFEFIGFDACLMGTLETASMLSKYSNYMIGSEETEPGYGWNYTGIGEYLTNNSGCDGADIGKVICDGFYEMCSEIGAEDQATLAVIDLSKIGDITSKFDEYFQQVYEKTDDIENLVEFARNAELADNFGGNNKTEGYTNMADLAGLIDCSSGLADGSDELKELISDAVSYNICGSAHAQACGLSMYYPYSIQGSEELSIFNSICTSPYYMAFVNKLAYAAANGGDLSGYSDETILSGSSEQADVEYADDITSEDSKFIKFETEPNLDENGTYSCKLTEESLDYTVDAQGVLAMLSGDTSTAMILGYSNDCISADWSTGVFTDNFDGTWFALSDGQLLTVYTVEKTDEYAILTSPIKLNGEETNLRIKYDLNDASASIIGIWDGISESGASARSTDELKSGDKIVPMYYVMAVDTDDEKMIDGSEFVYDGDSSITHSSLPDGNYLYGFSFDDLYGDSLITDMISYTVDGDKIGYDDLSE